MPDYISPHASWIKSENVFIANQLITVMNTSI